jgi:zinc/manganese transport system substrate-binding protein
MFRIYFWGLALLSTVSAKEPLRVVTTTSDLAALVRTVGGNRVQVDALVKGTQDPHHIEVLPSYMMKLRQADLFFTIGMDLDLWALPLRDGSRNANLVMIDCSSAIQRLEIPTSDVNAGMGDIHIYGNPHYWLDPENGKVLLQTISTQLTSLSPADGPFFEANRQAYTARLTEKIKEWQTLLAPFQGQSLIFYHNSWPYFLKRFGLQAANFIEPKPGISPSPAHTQQLIRQIHDHSIKAIAMEPFFDSRVPKMISAQTGAKVLLLPSSVGGVKEAVDYIALFDYIVTTLSAGLK